MVSRGELKFVIAANELFAISDVDTRALVNYIRENGAQNAVISSENKSDKELNELVKKAPSDCPADPLSLILIVSGLSFSLPNFFYCDSLLIISAFIIVKISRYKFSFLTLFPIS